MKFSKISSAHRHQLLQIYLHMGDEEAAAMCEEAGVARTYARTVAHQMGLYRKIKRKSKPPTPLASGRLRIHYVDHRDPRWARAIAIGPVIA